MNAKITGKGATRPTCTKLADDQQIRFLPAVQSFLTSLPRPNFAKANWTLRALGSVMKYS